MCKSEGGRELRSETVSSRLNYFDGLCSPVRIKFCF